MLFRLRFGGRFTLIGLVLVAALAVAGHAYLSVQHDRISFSAKERAGIRVIKPSGRLLATLTAGDPDPAAIDAAVEVDGGELASSWRTLRGSIDGALATGRLRARAAGRLAAGAAAEATARGLDTAFAATADEDRTPRSPARPPRTPRSARRSTGWSPPASTRSPRAAGPSCSSPPPSCCWPSTCSSRCWSPCAAAPPA